MTDAILDAMRSGAPYKKIAAQFGVTENVIWKLARKHHMQRPRGRKVGEKTTVCKQPDERLKCFLCGILFDEIDEGIAVATFDGIEHRVCQTCIKRSARLWTDVLTWEREPVKLGGVDEAT